MNNATQILTDEEIDAAWIATPADPNGNDFVGFARAIEQAVLSKLRGTGEPSDDDTEKLWHKATGQHLFPGPISRDEARALLSRYAAPQASAEARNAALEEAARLCEQISDDFPMPTGEGSTHWINNGYGCAGAIRALKSDPAAQPTIVKLHAWGGQSRHHDYLMSDGSIRTLKDTEANAMRRAEDSAKGAGDVVDPMDTPLPCDITIGHGTIRKGVKLRTLVSRMQTLFDMAHDRQQRGGDVDGRAAFEAWMRKEHPLLDLEIRNGEYRFTPAREKWSVWQGRASLVAQPAVSADPVGIHWVPLPEDPNERETFDRSLERIHGGDPRVAMASALSIWSHALPHGSFGLMCTIFANEIAKLHLAAPVSALSAQKPVEGDAKDAERYRLFRTVIATEDRVLLNLLRSAVDATGKADGQLATEAQIDAAFDAAIAQQGKEGHGGDYNEDGRV